VFAVFGYRQGLAAGVLSLTGFACGAAAGAAAAPGLSSALVAAGPNRDFLAIVIAFVAAVTGMLLGSVLAGLLRRVSRRPAGLVDSIGGAALNVMFLLAVVAMIASFTASGPPGPLSRQVDHSLVLQTLDRVAPKDAGDLFNSIRVSMLSRLGDASGLEAADLPRPNRAELKSPAAALARRAVVKVEVVAQSCPPSSPSGRDGSGFVIGRDHILTNAHVVAGLTQLPVVALASGRKYRAHVVLYDRRRDIAVLYVPGLRATTLRFSRSSFDAASAVVAGFPGGGRFTVTPATVGPRVTGDVDGTNWDRQVYPVRGEVQLGDSGGPVMAPDGQVYGVVFAKSDAAPPSGWALTASYVAGDAHAGQKLTRVVPAPLSC
jgi:S1-C subfamily serine protease